MYPYETLFVLRTELPEAQIRETIERAKRLIEGLEGVVTEVQDWGVRDLAYPIHKLHRGYYVLLRYNAKPAVVWEFERTLKIADEVLRFVTVRQQVVKEKKGKRAARPGPPRPPRETETEEMPEEL